MPSMKTGISTRNASHESQSFAPRLRYMSYVGLFISSPTFSGSHRSFAILVCDKLATDGGVSARSLVSVAPTFSAFHSQHRRQYERIIRTSADERKENL